MPFAKRETKLLQRIICILCLAIAASIATFAQAGRGGIGGLVTDSSGAVVPGAKVELENTARGFGEIASTANTPRQIQFAAKFNF